jgi:hypothetical protein
MRRPTRRRHLAGLAVALLLTSAVIASVSYANSQTGTIHVYEEGTISAPRHSVVITGAFADAGSFGAPSSAGTIELRLANGTIKADDRQGAAAEGAVFANIGKYLDPSTCALSFGYNARIKLLSGTGAYAGISGTVTTKTRDAGVFPRTANGTCNVNANPSGYIDIGIGSGSVSLK